MENNQILLLTEQLTISDLNSIWEIFRDFCGESAAEKKTRYERCLALQKIGFLPSLTAKLKHHLKRVLSTSIRSFNTASFVSHHNCPSSDDNSSDDTDSSDGTNLTLSLLITSLSSTPWVLATSSKEVAK